MPAAACHDEASRSKIYSEQKPKQRCNTALYRIGAALKAPLRGQSEKSDERREELKWKWEKSIICKHFSAEYTVFGVLMHPENVPADLKELKKSHMDRLKRQLL